MKFYDKSFKCLFFDEISKIYLFQFSLIFIEFSDLFDREI